MLGTCQRFGVLFIFGLVWQYSSVQTKYDKGRFKDMAAVPSYAGSALKRVVNFCNCYFSLLHFWTTYDKQSEINDRNFRCQHQFLNSNKARHTSSSAQNSVIYYVFICIFRIKIIHATHRYIRAERCVPQWARIRTWENPRF